MSKKSGSDSRLLSLKNGSRNPSTNNTSNPSSLEESYVSLKTFYFLICRWCNCIAKDLL